MAVRKSQKAAEVPQGAVSTPVRNTAVPPRASTSSMSSSGKRPAPSQDQIARKAYEIWQSGKGGSQDDNWYRAERELRGY